VLGKQAGPVANGAASDAVELEPPAGYKGLAAFHRYWGKKPVDYVEFLVRALSEPGDLVLDPFLGSGLSGLATTDLGRRFIGVDLNPTAVELGRLFTALPPYGDYRAAVARLNNRARPIIEQTYAMSSGETASHYLWNEGGLTSVWSRRQGVRGRVEHAPMKHDLALSQRFSDYAPHSIAPLHTFHNARINAHKELSMSDLFTGRALHNIDALQDAIADEPTQLRRALNLTLTASAGQMSRMVFAITGRGKATGEQTDRVEVGSWVIGFWRPTQHFEINCWTCFSTRARRLESALKLSPERPSPTMGTNLADVANGVCDAFIVLGDATEAMNAMPTASTQLVLADPPHTDRVPYLELSAMWNALLGAEPAYSDELVVSNARGRAKSLDAYADDLAGTLRAAGRIVRLSGYVALFFNSSRDRDWTMLAEVIRHAPTVRYLGAVPMEYSAGSVVQDNREGALKHDFVLLFSPTAESQPAAPASMRDLPGWTDSPVPGFLGAVS
jgi:hypothetical protein